MTDEAKEFFWGVVMLLAAVMPPHITSLDVILSTICGVGGVFSLIRAWRM